MKDVIRSCFGGINGAWIISGDESEYFAFCALSSSSRHISSLDQRIYAWNRETEYILETLAGHTEGSVNSVAWNPVDDGVFASCGDDGQVRIWEAPVSQSDASLRGGLDVRTNGSSLFMNGSSHVS